MKLSIFRSPKQPKPSQAQSPNLWPEKPQEPPDHRNPISLPEPLADLARADTLVDGLKQHILDRLFLISVGLGIIVFALNLPLAIQQSRWLALGLLSLVLLGLIAAAVLHRIAYAWRASILLLALFGVGLTSLVMDGLYGNGRIFLLVVPFLTAVLIGKRSRTASLALSIAAVALIGVLMVSGVIPAPGLRPGTANDSLLSWLIATINFGLLAIAGVLSFSILIFGMKESLDREHTLNDALENERTRLEAQVQQRTDDLQRRLVQIRTTAEINRAISRVLDVDRLLPQVCELVRQRFDLYYVGIFLIDEDANRQSIRDRQDMIPETGPLSGRSDDLKELARRTFDGREGENSSNFQEATPSVYAVLRAGSGEAGRRMLSEGHKLAVGGDSMIGWATANRQPRISQNVGQEVVRFNNPHLPLTRSELALPILIHETTAEGDLPPVDHSSKTYQNERVLGAMSIQSIKEATFDQDDILILQSIADGLASAIENARLFAATQSSLEEIRTLHRQYLEQAWRLETALRGEIIYSFENQPQAPDKAAAQGQSLVMPIRLRDQVIGSLTLEPGDIGSQPDDEGREWTSEELSLIESVTNQAALALENARLLEETRRKVDLEHTATNITSKLWASADVETILQTVLQELSVSLGAHDGWIELQTAADKTPQRSSAETGSSDHDSPENDLMEEHHAGD